MNEMNNSPGCERAPDLIAFLYDETDARETREFENHVRQCQICREEVAAFRGVRESLIAWRDESLGGFIPSPLTVKPGRKSAIAACRQFFDLSPWWLKSATAFAAIAFCLLAALVFKPQPNRRLEVSESVPPVAVYTKQDVDRMVKEALAKAQPTVTPEETAATTSSVQKSKSSKPIESNQRANSRRPLSRAEREQLAADLRLLSTPDDDRLDLIGDRLNR